MSDELRAVIERLKRTIDIAIEYELLIGEKPPALYREIERLRHEITRLVLEQRYVHKTRGME